MKKSRLITLVLLVSSVLLGAGYAAWSKTLTINNTVTTAKFDVVFEDGPSVPSSPNTTAAGTISSDSHSLQIDIAGLYPHAHAGVSKIIKNNSSIPVKINSVILGSVSDSTNKIDSNGILTHDIIITNSVDHSANGSRVKQLISNSTQALNTKLQSFPIHLAPGESCVFMYIVTWYDNDEAYETYKNQTLSYTYKFSYTQDTN